MFVAKSFNFHPKMWQIQAACNCKFQMSRLFWCPIFYGCQVAEPPQVSEVTCQAKQTTTRFQEFDSPSTYTMIYEIWIYSLLEKLIFHRLEPLAELDCSHLQRLGSTDSEMSYQQSNSACFKASVLYLCH